MFKSDKMGYVYLRGVAVYSSMIRWDSILLNGIGICVIKHKSVVNFFCTHCALVISQGSMSVYRAESNNQGPKTTETTKTKYIEDIEILR